MENLLQNKAKFFAQYWNQKVMTKVVRGENKAKITTHDVVCSNWKFVELVESYLELRDISSIIDDELGAIARFYKPNAKNVYIYDDQLTFDYYSGDETHSVAVELNSGYCFDYLRMNGFAMEWMGLCITKLEEYGWLKLKTN